MSLETFRVEVERLLAAPATRKVAQDERAGSAASISPVCNLNREHLATYWPTDPDRDVGDRVQPPPGYLCLDCGRDENDDVLPLA